MEKGMYVEEKGAGLIGSRCQSHKYKLSESVFADGLDYNNKECR